MPTRQQRRARSRRPTESRRRTGTYLFLFLLTVLVAAGATAIALTRTNPPERVRGAGIGDHWHARYAIDICGKRLAPFPHVPGDVHSHGDGVIHVHPTRVETAHRDANLGTFLRTYETHIGVLDDERRGIILPDGQRYADGDTCEDGRAHDLGVYVNDEPWEGDPSEYLVQDGDVVHIRFGPEATERGPNPYFDMFGPRETEEPDDAPIE